MEEKSIYKVMECIDNDLFVEGLFTTIEKIIRYVSSKQEKYHSDYKLVLDVRQLMIIEVDLDTLKGRTEIIRVTRKENNVIEPLICTMLSHSNMTYEVKEVCIKQAEKQLWITLG